MIFKLRSLCLLISLIFLLFFFARPFLLEPQFAQGEESPMQTERQVFHSVVDSFAILSSLTKDVIYANDSIYPIVLHASNQKEAIDLLSNGFTQDLAQALVHDYLAWDQDLAKLVLIPCDAIPILTMEDEAMTEITFRNDRQVRLQHLYYNCYAEGDCYRYVIEAEKEGTTWKISSLSLDEIKEGKKFE